MGSDYFEITVNFVKMVAIFLLMVQLVPLLVWVERRGSAFIQNRFGPNRIGPLGLTQLAADGIKFLFKEEFIPPKGNRSLFLIAPIIALIPGAVAFGSIPLSIPIEISEFTMFGSTYGPYVFPFQSFEIGIGIVFVLGVSSLGAYSMLLAGFGSSNKYSLYGALRASAQMISYELAMGLAIVGILIIYGTFDFAEMIAAQSGPLNLSFLAADHSINKVLAYLPNWGIFFQPLGFILLFVAVFAETNRLPFDLPEAESELVAGYHTEYGGIKMNMFYIGEYGHMMVASALLATFYFGGYSMGPILDQHLVDDIMVSGLYSLTSMALNAINEAGMWHESQNLYNVLRAFVYHGILMAKILLFLWVFIWVRWTLPRFRYDQLMDLGWKTMLPWALANTLITALLVLWLS